MVSRSILTGRRAASSRVNQYRGSPLWAVPKAAAQIVHATRKAVHVTGKEEILCRDAKRAKKSLAQIRS